MPRLLHRTAPPLLRPHASLLRHRSAHHTHAALLHCVTTHRLRIRTAALPAAPARLYTTCHLPYATILPTRHHGHHTSPTHATHTHHHAYTLATAPPHTHLAYHHLQHLPLGCAYLSVSTLRCLTLQHASPSHHTTHTPHTHTPHPPLHTARLDCYACINIFSGRRH